MPAFLIGAFAALVGLTGLAFSHESGENWPTASAKHDLGVAFWIMLVALLIAGYAGHLIG